MFYDFGLPVRIISDRDTSFTSTAFKTFCNQVGIKHELNAVACPRANGQVERFNRTFIRSLAAPNTCSNKRDWDTFGEALITPLMPPLRKLQLRPYSA